MKNTLLAITLIVTGTITMTSCGAETSAVVTTEPLNDSTTVVVADSTGFDTLSAPVEVDTTVEVIQ
jgi:hypothetical protein